MGEPKFSEEELISMHVQFQKSDQKESTLLSIINAKIANKNLKALNMKGVCEPCSIRGNNIIAEHEVEICEEEGDAPYTMHVCQSCFLDIAKERDK